MLLKKKNHLCYVNLKPKKSLIFLKSKNIFCILQFYICSEVFAPTQAMKKCFLGLLSVLNLSTIKPWLQVELPYPQLSSPDTQPLFDSFIISLKI